MFFLSITLRCAEWRVQVPPGQYGIEFDLTTTPTEDDPFEPGPYRVIFEVCEGSCGSSHHHSFVYDKSTTNFTIVP